MRTLLRIGFGFVYGAVVGGLIGPLAGMALIYILAGAPLGNDPSGVQGVLWILVAAALGAISSGPWALIWRGCLGIGAGLSAGIAALYVLILTTNPPNPAMPLAIPRVFLLVLVCPLVSGAAAGAVAAARQESFVQVIMFERP